MWASAAQLRNLFVTVLMYRDVGDAGKLFDKYWKYLVDDILYTRRRALQNQHYDMPEILQKSCLLKELGRLFANNGGALSSYNLPDVVCAAASGEANRLIFEETCYGSEQQFSEWESLLSTIISSNKL